MKEIDEATETDKFGEIYPTIIWLIEKPKHVMKIG